MYAWLNGSAFFIRPSSLGCFSFSFVFKIPLVQFWRNRFLIYCQRQSADSYRWWLCLRLMPEWKRACMFCAMCARACGRGVGNGQQQQRACTYINLSKHRAPPPLGSSLLHGQPVTTIPNHPPSRLPFHLHQPYFSHLKLQTATMEWETMRWGIICNLYFLVNKIENLESTYWNETRTSTMGYCFGAVAQENFPWYVYFFVANEVGFFHQGYLVAAGRWLLSQPLSFWSVCNCCWTTI